MRIRRAGFACAPFTSTLPPETAWAARLRVLKKRAAHNHLSSRSEGAGGISGEEWDEVTANLNREFNPEKVTVYLQIPYMLLTCGGVTCDGGALMARMGARRQKGARPCR